MGKKRYVAAAAAILAGGLVLTSCAPPQPVVQQTALNQATTVSVMWNQVLYSVNKETTFGNATTNTNIIYMTRDNWLYYDKDLNIVPDKGYGTYEKVSDDPLTVKMTFADGAQWSDGTPLSAADVILAWGAESTMFNTVKDASDAGLENEDGTLKPNGDGQVYFDANITGINLIKDFPQISDDLKTVTITYSKPFADWEHVMGDLGAGQPAHIVAKRALGVDDPTAANQALVDAFKNNDKTALSKIANVWNSDFNFKKMPSPELVLSCGPYVMTDYKENSYLTLSKNDKYKGAHKAPFDTITVRYNGDPQANVQALQNDEVQLISPQPTADILKALQNQKGISVISGDEATYEHVDLTFNNNGPFSPKAYKGDTDKARLVRQAFLYTIPRQTILENIIKPLNPNAEIRNSFNVVPGADGYDEVVQANGMATTYAQTDIDKAKSLLSQAGVSKPKVRVLYDIKNTRRQQEFALMKESAEKAGFQIIDNGNADWGQKLGDGTYDASLFGWQTTTPAVTEPAAEYVTNGANNFGGYSNKQIDTLYDQLYTETDPAQQKAINEQVEKILVDDAFSITIFQFPSVTAFSDTLSGIDPITISPTIFWNYWDWKLGAGTK